MEEQIKVLKMMSEVTGRMDLNEFARIMNSTPKQVLQRMEELTKADFVKKIGAGYGVTEKGKTVLRAYAVVPDVMEFRFYLEIGQPTDIGAKSLKEFCEQIRKVEIASVEFHLYRKDFENWVNTVFKDTYLAEEFSKIRAKNVHGEELRNELLNVTEAKYHLNEL